VSTLRVRLDPQAPPADFARRVILTAVHSGAEMVEVVKNHGGDAAVVVFSRVMGDLDAEGLLPERGGPQVRFVCATRSERAAS
jgi:hypothetical protein